MKQLLVLVEITGSDLTPMQYANSHKMVIIGLPRPPHPVPQSEPMVRLLRIRHAGLLD